MLRIPLEVLNVLLFRIDLGAEHLQPWLIDVPESIGQIRLVSNVQVNKPPPTSTPTLTPTPTPPTPTPNPNPTPPTRILGLLLLLPLLPSSCTRPVLPVAGEMVYTAIQSSSCTSDRTYAVQT